MIDVKVIQVERDSVFNVADIRHRIFDGLAAIANGTDINLFERIVVGELLQNAIRYGRGVIEVTVDVRSDAIEITVSDEGDGFDPAIIDCENVTDGLDCGTHGRGYAMIKAVSDEVRFSRAYGKFTVTVTKRLT